MVPHHWTFQPQCHKKVFAAFGICGTDSGKMLVVLTFLLILQYGLGLCGYVWEIFGYNLSANWEIRYGWHTADIRRIYGWHTADIRLIYGWHKADIRARYRADIWNLGRHTKSSYDILKIIILESLFGRISVVYSVNVSHTSGVYIGRIASS